MNEKQNQEPIWSVIIPTWDLKRAMSCLRTLLATKDPLRHAVIMYTGPTALSLSNVDELMTEVGEMFPGRRDTPIHLDLRPGALHLPVLAMARGAQTAMENGATHLLFLHDDTEVLEPWAQYLTQWFSMPNSRCGLAGFGGRLGFGTRDIYRTPYRLDQLVGVDFLSWMDNWQDHGGPLYQAQRVAYLDGFSLAMSATSYALSGGWERCLADGIDFHMYDAWMSLRMAELGMEVWALPVGCHHQGGQTSVLMKEAYEQAVRNAGYIHGQELFEEAHLRIYERFRGVLPIPPYARRGMNGQVTERVLHQAAVTEDTTEVKEEV